MTMVPFLVLGTPWVTKILYFLLLVFVVFWIFCDCLRQVSGLLSFPCPEVPWARPTTGWARAD